MIARHFSSPTLSLVTALLFAGCGALPIPPCVDRTLLARKPASLTGWCDGKTERGKTLQTTKLRTALLLTGWEKIMLKPAHEAPGEISYKISLGGSRGASAGSAVPISNDGYFLTAAHCVADPRQLTLIVLTRDLRLVKSPARVVWTSGPSLGVDLALIHAPIQPAGPFPLADPVSLRTGEPVAIAGWSKLGFKKSSGAAAGKITAISPWHHDGSGFVWRTIEHDTPFNSGDSGGPLVTTDGHLAAINALAVPSATLFLRALARWDSPTNQPLAGYTARSFAAGHEWLRRVIEADRATHAIPGRRGGPI